MREHARADQAAHEAAMLVVPDPPSTEAARAARRAEADAARSMLHFIRLWWARGSQMRPSGAHGPTEVHQPPPRRTRIRWRWSPWSP